MKKLLPVFALVFMLFCFCSSGFGEATEAGSYFDQATAQYLLGDFNAALENVDLVLKADSHHAGAIKLKESILKELQERGIAVGEPTPEAVPAVTREAVPAAAAEAVPVQTAVSAGTIVSAALTLLLIVVSLVLLAGKMIGVLGDKKEEEARGFKSEAGLKIWTAVSDEQKLWYKKLNWTANPFTLDIHPELFTGYEKEVKEILGKIKAHSGHILITGPLGIGKTTLLRWLADQLPARDYHAVYVSRPPLEFGQLIEHVAKSMGITAGKKDARENNIYNFNELRGKTDKNLLLLLDEAHEFTIEIERPLRTVGDMDRVNLVMAGLPETTDKLKNEIQPLYDRLVLKISLDHLEMAALKELIKVRIESVGGKGVHPFTATALEKIYSIAGGNPRSAIRLCDAAVAAAIERGEEIISADLVNEDTK